MLILVLICEPNAGNALNPEFHVPSVSIIAALGRGKGGIVGFLTEPSSPTYFGRNATLNRDY